MSCDSNLSGTWHGKKKKKKGLENEALRVAKLLYIYCDDARDLLYVLLLPCPSWTAAVLQPVLEDLFV